MRFEKYMNGLISKIVFKQSNIFKIENIEPVTDLPVGGETD